MCLTGLIPFPCRTNLLSTLINCLKSEDSNVRKVIWSTILFLHCLLLLLSLETCRFRCLGREQRGEKQEQDPGMLD